jgi:hypothetical protein
MENIKIELTEEKLKEAVFLAVEEVFKSSYRNPFVDIIQEELKKEDSKFRELFSSVIGDIMTNPGFKKQLGELAMKSLIEKAFKN